MIAEYMKIKDEYDKFYNDLLADGKLPLRATEKGFWGIAVADDIIELFKKLNLKKAKNFLGCIKVCAQINNDYEGQSWKGYSGANRN